MANRKPLVVIHPALLTIYPVLLLYSQNVSEVRFSEVPKPAALLLAATMVLLLIWRLLVRDWAKAGLLVSLMVLLAFAYAPVYELLRTASPSLFGYLIGRHRVLLVVWGILFLGFSAAIIRTRRNLVLLTIYANVFSIILVCFSTISIVGHEWQMARNSDATRSWEEMLAKDDAIELTPKKPLRDVYYIVLDEYARADVIKEYFGYDNTPFLEYLKNKGFYVATDAHSDYLSTYRSLASTLNFELLDSLGTSTVNDRLLEMVIEDNRISRLMKRAGYEFVFFPSGYQTTYRNRNADLILAPGAFNPGEFDRTLMRNSILYAFNAAGVVHRRRLMYAFDELERIPDIKQPTFTFAHILCPHTPYVFDKDGGHPQQDIMRRKKPADEEWERTERLYVGQVQYLNKQMERVIDAIIAKSEVPPIIIIQADHGMRMPIKHTAGSPEYDNEVRRNCRNLSAFYFPDGGDAALNDSMRNVNTFRVLLDTYFGTDFGLVDGKPRRGGQGDDKDLASQ